MDFQKQIVHIYQKLELWNLQILAPLGILLNDLVSRKNACKTKNDITFDSEYAVYEASACLGQLCKPNYSSS